MADLLKEYFIKFHIGPAPETLIIPIPLHVLRKRKRGFNQAELVAEVLSQNLKIPLVSSVLKKTKNTKSQIELRAEERRQNLNSVFSVKNPDIIRNKTIFLLDDVKTTGTTLEKAAQELKKGGAKKIIAITFAR